MSQTSSKKDEYEMDDKFTAQQLERRCRELEDAVRVEKMKNSGSEITRKRLQKRLNNTQSETADYKSQMEYLLSMKEKLESSVKKYETAASQAQNRIDDTARRIRQVQGDLNDTESRADEAEGTLNKLRRRPL